MPKRQVFHILDRLVEEKSEHFQLNCNRKKFLGLLGKQLKIYIEF